MKKYTILLLCFVLLSELYSNVNQKKMYYDRLNSPHDIAGREDRKDGVHSGNRVLTRIYNHGAIGDQSSSFSGVYPIGSGHAYIYEFSPVIAASVLDTNGNRKHIISDGTIGLTDDSPEGTPWGFEPLTGFANPNQENLAMSDNTLSWPNTWPNRSAFLYHGSPFALELSLSSSDLRLEYVISSSFI